MAVVHSFTLGGVADTALGVVLRAGYQEPMLPSTRDASVEVPGRQGRWDFGSELGAREFSLDLALIDTTTQAALATAIRTFAKVLLDDDGNPIDVSLVFAKEPTLTYTVRYSGNLPLQRLVGSSKGYFTLPLVAADPFAYGAGLTTTATITANGQKVPIVNGGDYRVPPVITITNNGKTTVNGFTLVLVGPKP